MGSGLAGVVALVTGGTGFIGSHLVESLLNHGAEVRILARPDTIDPSRRSVALSSDVRDHVEFVHEDIRDASSVERAMKDVDRVFHLAGLGSVPNSYDRPLEYVATNVNGGANILHAALVHDVERVVMFSSSEVYASSPDPIDERGVLLPRSPYAGSKIAADELARSFRVAYGLPVTILRSFYAYGPRQPSRNLVPTAMRQLDDGAPFRLTAADFARDYVHVNDIVGAAIALTNSKTADEWIFNVGSGVGVTISDIVGHLARLMEVEPQLIVDLTAAEVEESQSRIADISAIRSAVGWYPRWDLVEGLRQTVDAFREGERGTRRPQARQRSVLRATRQRLE